MSGRGRDLRVATRGSTLARRQTATVVDALEARRFDCEVREVETAGDQVRDELIENLGTTGAFVRSLDEKVLEGEADLAVHSLKDVPTEMPDDLVVAAVPERAPAGDVLVTPDGVELADLPPESVVGTASTRRRAQILSERPDLTVEPVRGNVDTRVEKLLAPTLQAEHEARLDAAEDEESEDGEDEDDEEDAETYDRTPEEWFDGLSEIARAALGREVDTEYDAVVLAEAGLRRSGLADHVPYARLPRERFVPAPGQGALAVTARDGDLAEDVFAACNHARSRVETSAERIVLETVGGGCITPIGVNAVVQGSYLHVDAAVFAGDGTESVTLTRDVPADDYAADAREVGETLLDRGADALLEGEP